MEIETGRLPKDEQVPLDVYKRQLQDIVALQAENRFSRIPVYKEDLDDIVGAVFVKDLRCV